MAETRLNTPAPILSADILSAIAARLSERADAINQLTLVELVHDLRLAAQCAKRLAVLRGEITDIADCCANNETRARLRALVATDDDDGEGE